MGIAIENGAKVDEDRWASPAMGHKVVLSPPTVFGCYKQKGDMVKKQGGRGGSLVCYFIPTVGIVLGGNRNFMNSAALRDL